MKYYVDQSDPCYPCIRPHKNRCDCGRCGSFEEAKRVITNEARMLVDHWKGILSDNRKETRASVAKRCREDCE